MRRHNYQRAANRVPHTRKSLEPVFGSYGRAQGQLDIIRSRSAEYQFTFV